MRTTTTAATTSTTFATSTTTTSMPMEAEEVTTAALVANATELAKELSAPLVEAVVEWVGNLTGNVSSVVDEFGVDTDFDKIFQMPDPVRLEKAEADLFQSLVLMIPLIMGIGAVINYFLTGWFATLVARRETAAFRCKFFSLVLFLMKFESNPAIKVEFHVILQLSLKMNMHFVGVFHFVVSDNCLF